MKRKDLIMFVAASCLISCFLLPGCDKHKQIGSKAIKNIKLEEKARLQEDVTSPSCQITIDYNYLAESDLTDTVTRRINQTILASILGKEYALMTPEAAIDSFKKAYIAEYRKDVNDFYQEDIKNVTTADELPAWYNYEYGLTTQLDSGKEGILNVIAATYTYTGGAHPNSWQQWMNFDSNTGKQLMLKEVFIKGAEKPISEMLLKELIKEMAVRLEDPSITSLEGLQDAGILNWTDIYVPENFLLEKDKISFLYNKYDIAPYAIGAIVLSFPYERIEKYMIH